MLTVATRATCPACSGAADVPRCRRCEAWVLQVPAAQKVLTENDRHHWAPRNALVQQWRISAGYTARHLKIPTFERVHIWAHWNAADTRRRDPDNCYMTVKACIDGLVDAGVVADDDHTRVIGPDIRLGPPLRPSTITLAIVPEAISD